MVVVRLFLRLISVPLPPVYGSGLKTRHWLSKAPRSMSAMSSGPKLFGSNDPRNPPDGKITTITANQGQINTALAAALARFRS